MGLFKQEGNTAAALVKLAETFSDDKEELARQIDLSKVRNYSIEEQADDVAIEVLRNVKSSAKPLIEFFKASIPSHEITGCLATVAADRVPGYGVLSDNHHSTCYRIYHAQKFEAYLESQK